VGLDDTGRFFLDARGGDDAAWNDFLRRLRPWLVLWVASRLSDALRAKEDPEDIAQDVLADLEKERDRTRGMDWRPFLGYVKQVAENTIRDLVRRGNADKRRERPPPGSHSQTSPSTAAARRDLLHKVHEALGRLPEDHRLVIRLRRLEERPDSEVAQIMGRSEVAVRVLYCRALKELKHALGQDGSHAGTAVPL
jgi:RNA polymerase sigma-70 factor (ECF subfamily)